MNRKTFKQFLIEAPIANYDTVGDFSRGSSFRDKRDRFLVTNPRTIEIVKKKFSSTEHVFNFIFVNSALANRHTEVGRVSLGWVRQNLGDDVASKIKFDDDYITIIFTNNKGSERAPLTGWMMAHRIGHVMVRANGMRRDHSPYDSALEALVSGFIDIMEYYGVNIDYRNSRDFFRSPRHQQLLLKNFFSKVATFRSAREGILRDWFEVMNELVAQYLTTGKIKFNKAPTSFTSNRHSYRIRNPEQIQEVNDSLDSLSRTMEYMISDIFSEAYGSIYVM